ncbi:E3 ubiquitin-protein ligase COP1 [Dendrobium catenatum]|uniref:E3 ubiquitin-protein ligase COP1 n=1 Tax=Dendrobium catenatum TaxID=906689 RepID=A0A2I0WZM6_9ASPA|nr:E3 ubiquitin-protein ligase COP1 [Dendrobium catenatum]
MATLTPKPTLRLTCLVPPSSRSSPASLVRRYDSTSLHHLPTRRHGASQLSRQGERDENPINREAYHAGLQDFQSVLTTFTRYSRLRVIAEVRHGDLFHSANIVSRLPGINRITVFSTFTHEGDYLKFKAYAASIAEEMRTELQLKDLPLENASQEDLNLINISIDEEENQEDGKDWTSKLGVNLRYYVKFRKHSASKIGPQEHQED